MSDSYDSYYDSESGTGSSYDSESDKSGSYDSESDSDASSSGSDSDSNSGSGSDNESEYSQSATDGNTTSAMTSAATSAATSRRTSIASVVSPPKKNNKKHRGSLLKKNKAPTIDTTTPSKEAKAQANQSVAPSTPSHVNVAELASWELSQVALENQFLDTVNLAQKLIADVSAQQHIDELRAKRNAERHHEQDPEACAQENREQVQTLLVESVVAAHRVTDALRDYSTAHFGDDQTAFLPGAQLGPQSQESLDVLESVRTQLAQAQARNKMLGEALIGQETRVQSLEDALMQQEAYVKTLEKRGDKSKMELVHKSLSSARGLHQKQKSRAEALELALAEEQANMRKAESELQRERATAERSVARLNKEVKSLKRKLSKSKKVKSASVVLENGQDAQDQKLTPEQLIELLEQERAQLIGQINGLERERKKAEDDAERHRQQRHLARSKTKRLEKHVGELEMQLEQTQHDASRQAALILDAAEASKSDPSNILSGPLTVANMHTPRTRKLTPKKSRAFENLAAGAYGSPSRVRPPTVQELSDLKSHEARVKREERQGRIAQRSVSPRSKSSSSSARRSSSSTAISDSPWRGAGSPKVVRAKVPTAQGLSQNKHALRTSSHKRRSQRSSSVTSDSLQYVTDVLAKTSMDPVKNTLASIGNVTSVTPISPQQFQQPEPAHAQAVPTSPHTPASQKAHAQPTSPAGHQLDANRRKIEELSNSIRRLQEQMPNLAAAQMTPEKSDSFSSPFASPAPVTATPPTTAVKADSSTQHRESPPAGQLPQRTFATSTLKGLFDKNVLGHRVEDVKEKIEAGEALEVQDLDVEANSSGEDVPPPQNHPEAGETLQVQG